MSVGRPVLDHEAKNEASSELADLTLGQGCEFGEGDLSA